MLPSVTLEMDQHPPTTRVLMHEAPSSLTHKFSTSNTLPFVLRSLRNHLYPSPPFLPQDGPTPYSPVIPRSRSVPRPEYRLLHRHIP